MSKCKKLFRIPEGEELDHDCPFCGFSSEELFEQVYCTDCSHFNVLVDKDENIPFCEYGDECDITNCEDSKRRMDRPYYKP